MFCRKLYEKLQESQFDGDEGERNSKEPRKVLQSEGNHIFFNVHKWSLKSLSLVSGKNVKHCMESAYRKTGFNGSQAIHLLCISNLLSARTTNIFLFIEIRITIAIKMFLIKLFDIWFFKTRNASI